MANKITCTCGHSWNKSDSSKKDMNVCHICGKDNTMKDGGWLDKYEQGGLVLKQKTHDNYGKKPNANYPEVTLPPGFVGQGYNIKGRNYSPAWGGQFQNGGNLMPPMAGADQTVPMAQTGTRQPIYTSDLQDPRLRAYNDSLSLYKAYDEIYKELKGTGKITSEYPYENFRMTPRVGTINDVDSYLSSKQETAYKKDEIQPISEYSFIEDSKDRYIDGTLYLGQKNATHYSHRFKKPVQPVIYKKRTLERPTLESIDIPSIELTSTRPAITQPTFEQAKVDMSTPTKYSFTYPTGKYLEDKTIYFPDRSSWKTFVEQQRGASSQEGKDYGSATAQFAMGGSLPGAVGFTYARTAGAAPANGPYAKKTKASAQNGQEMKYYQEGLDFKPKTISQNGRNITTDINDYNRWKDSVNNYIKGQKDFAESRSAVKKNIDSFSLLKGSGLVAAFTNLIEGDYLGRRRIAPKYSEDAIPKKYWYSEGRKEQQPMTVIAIGDNAYNTNTEIPGLVKSITDATKVEDWTGLGTTPYNDIVALYHPPVRKNLQYVKPSSDKIYNTKNIKAKPPYNYPEGDPRRHGLFVRDIDEKEPKLERPIPIPRDVRDLGYNLPTPGAPSFPKLQEYNPDTPTKYTFTYPTGKYNEQKTMYFPTKSALKAFTQGVRGATYQEGDNWASATGNYQDGGEIAVDSMGYWNPDNWGNPVIIPSTDITMEGVDVPLIGISDTGDVQYMEPGEDYEFDGEYVTEYPMAKGGVSVNNADAQPIKKLDQLLNFTNYNKPTKGGWLDKYQ